MSQNIKRRNNMSKTIITCALTGAGDTKKKSPYVPGTPKKIAEDAIQAAKAGAAIVHIHVRDPETGNISHDPKLYREVVERIRDSKTDVVLNITAGGGGDWVPSEDDPTIGGEGTSMQTPKERHHPVEELLPEICTRSEERRVGKECRSRGCRCSTEERQSRQDHA